MSEKPPRDATAAETWRPEKAVIQNQDLEHQAEPETRVFNKGVPITPQPHDEEALEEKEELKKRGEEVFLP